MAQTYTQAEAKALSHKYTSGDIQAARTEISRELNIPSEQVKHLDAAVRVETHKTANPEWNKPTITNIVTPVIKPPTPIVPTTPTVNSIIIREGGNSDATLGQPITAPIVGATNYGGNSFPTVESPPGTTYIIGNDGNTYDISTNQPQIIAINSTLSDPTPVPPGFIQQGDKTINPTTGQQMNVDPFGNVTLQNGAVSGGPSGEGGTWNGISYANYDEYLSLQNAWMASTEGRRKTAEYNNILDAIWVDK
jgi:hypothetical protein